MGMTQKNRKIEVKGKEIGVTSNGKEDFICLTNIAKYKNPDFNVTEFRNIRYESGTNVITPKSGINIQ
jgi:hypothetical protein